MPDFGDKVTPGQLLTIKAETWNALLDTGHEFTDRKLGEAKRLPMESAPLVPGTTVYVRNATGAALAEFAAVKIEASTIAITPAPEHYDGGGVTIPDTRFDFAAQPVLDATSKAVAGYAFAITQEPIADGDLGRAVVVGVTLATVTIVAASDNWAAPKSSASDKLASGTSGPARIVWRTTVGGTGDMLCVIVSLAVPVAGSAAVWGYESFAVGADIPSDGGSTAIRSFTAPSAGVYHVTADVLSSIEISGSGRGIVYAQLVSTTNTSNVSGARMVNTCAAGSASQRTSPVTAVFSLAAGEVVDVRVWKIGILGPTWSYAKCNDAEFGSGVCGLGWHRVP